MRDKRSLLNFGVLLIAAVVVASFILQKGLDAIVDVDRVSDLPIYRERRELLGEEIDTSAWKTYRNEQYGFEFKFPPALKGNTSGDQFFGSYGSNSVNLLVGAVSVGESRSSNEQTLYSYVPLPGTNFQVEFYGELPYVKNDFEQIVSSFRFTK